KSQSGVGQPLSPVVGMCGPLQNHFGPFDYRTAPHADRSIVERFHFTPSVETLKRGNTGSIGGDLNYTLRVFPNHARALAAMARYAARLGSTKVPGAEYPAECYFDRAIRFAPDDAQVRALYADFLIQFKRPKDARDQLEAAERLNPSSPPILYNLALAWNALGDNDKAVPLARRAYAGGVQFPGLREKLKASGAWRD
ncbi:MAG: tetratricopeptide repeat protein, partial [Gammaproteobacteria bacterium]